MGQTLHRGWLPGYREAVCSMRMNGISGEYCFFCKLKHATISMPRFAVFCLLHQTAHSNLLRVRVACCLLPGSITAMVTQCLFSTPTTWIAAQLSGLCMHTRLRIWTRSSRAETETQTPTPHYCSSSRLKGQRSSLAQLGATSLCENARLGNCFSSVWCFCACTYKPHSLLQRIERMRASRVFDSQSACQSVTSSILP
jgi:hypothetical protein